ncbi:MAG: phosphatase PAP2 family protein [Syntrophobacterales bacterium]|nr:phosphatase PAP2 family protein [Syntrophobacterales bacterium]
MGKIFKIISGFVLAWAGCIPCYGDGVYLEDRGGRLKGFVTKVAKDYNNFYSKDRLVRTGIVFSLGALMANTPCDEEIQSLYQTKIRSSMTDAFSKKARLLGEWKYLMPSSALLASLSLFDDRSYLGNLGAKTLRSYLVGGLPVFVMQRVTGASRPGQDKHGSSWDLFGDSNGVSGHAFFGAVPFLVLAKTQEASLAKYAFYGGSLAAAFSRLNDSYHYFSQILLGWYLAYEATDAVFETKGVNRTLIFPVIGLNKYGLYFVTHW